MQKGTRTRCKRWGAGNLWAGRQDVSHWGVSDPFARKVYLQELPDPVLGARFSGGARRRAAQLQGFLRDLSEAATPLGPLQGAELLVIGSRDWRRLFSYPYGLPFTRSKPGGVSIVAAADYPPRLLRRFDAPLLRAAQAGERAPGDVREFLDLLVGHEWGHAAANLSGLRFRVKWLDEFMATYLFLLALQDTGAEGAVARFVQWARVEVAGSAVARADLGAFEYPRVRLPFDNLLWFQGVFTLRAAELVPTRGWDFPLAMRAAGARTRGDVASTLIEVEPSFKEWFVVFAEAS